MKTRINDLLFQSVLITGLGLMMAGRATAQTFTNLHSFAAGNYNSSGFYTNSEGIYPVGLIFSGSALFGTALSGGTNGAGTVFAVNTDGTSFTNPYSFTGNGDGATPNDVILSGNTLYGVANQGGTNGAGTVFAVNTDGTGFTILHSFAGYIGNPNDGSVPVGLILSGNTLYGVANQGGTTGGYGTIFAVNTNGSGFTNLYSFTASSYDFSLNIDTNSDGAYPSAGLILNGNTLYGTASQGGTNGTGTVFALSADGTGFTILHTFAARYFNSSLDHYTNSDGINPFGGLILSGNTLYGTTEEGGSANVGTVFAVSTNGTNFTILHSFTVAPDPSHINNDGANPSARLILSGNTLYGVAGNGGTSGNGTVFAINTGGTGFTNLHNFASASGPYPYTNSEGAFPDGLILSGNTLYGTAQNGGSSGNGTVFSISLPEPTNQPPVVANSIPDTNTIYGSTFNYTFPVNTFADPDLSDMLSYSVGGLPPGVAFDGPTRTFSGTNSGVGAYLVTVTATDNGTPPLSTNATFEINAAKALLTASAHDITNTYGGFIFVNSYVDVDYSGFKFDDENVFSLDSPPAISTSATSTSSVAAYPIHLSGGSDSHYSFDLHDGVMTLVPAPLTVVVYNYSRLPGQTNPPLSGRLVGLVNDDPISLSFSTTAIPGSPAGSYLISVTFNDPSLRLANYALTYLNGELTVLPYGFLFEIVHAFGSTNELGVADVGRNPGGAVMEGLDGVLYGITGSGGNANNGVIFRVNKNGTGYSVLHLLSVPEGDSLATAGPLIQGTNGLLFGAASGNGTLAPGMIFSADTNGINVNVLQVFSDNIGSSASKPLLLSTNGLLYGTTSNGKDTIYRIGQDGTGYALLWSNSVFGTLPWQIECGLIEGSDGLLYGGSVGGGDYFAGTVFRIAKDDGALQVIHSCTDAGVWARLTEGSDGWLYGVSSGGGMFYEGSVFKMAKDGSGFEVLHHFDSVAGDGSVPLGSLLEANDGYLYGTTRAGGSFAGVFGGTVYRLKKDGTSYSILHNFGPTVDDPSYLTSALIQASDGSFYGTTAFGGNVNGFSPGFIFRLTALAPPTLATTRSGANVLTVSWFPPTPGFVLQQNDLLDPLTWTDAPSGSTNPVTLPVNTSMQFFRLRLP